MSLRLVNLNLIPILRVLLKEASVTRAADILGLSQSATSEALGRLREVLGDPLLVQVGRTMRLTPRAEELIEPVARLCVDAEALLETSRFDPAVSQRHFRIGTGDVGVTEIGPVILNMLRRFAPGITVAFIDIHPGSLDLLASRDLDFAWLATFYLKDSGLASLRSVKWNQHRLVILLDPAHPLAQKQELDHDDLNQWPRIGLELEPGLLKPGRREELEGDLPIKPAVTLQHNTLQPSLIRGTDYWAVVAHQTAIGAAADMGLVYREAPSLHLASNETCLAWSAVQHSDPAHRWFRETLMHLTEERPA